MQESFSRLIGMDGIRERCKDSQDIWRRCEEQRDHVGISKSLYHRREEVGHRSRRHDAQEHDHQNPDLDVFEGQEHAVPERLLRAADPVVDTNVFLQTPDCQLTFFLSQPLSGSWKVRKNEEAHRGDSHCDGPFDDEQPLPSWYIKRSIHSSGDTGSDQTSKSPRNQRSRIQNGRPERQLFSGIPTREVEQASWKIRRLDETQEETDRKEACKVLRQCRCKRDQSPDDHHAWEVQCRLTDLVQEQVGGDLHQDVSDEEDRNAGLVLRVGHVEIRFQAGMASKSSGGDVVLYIVSLEQLPMGGGY